MNSVAGATEFLATKFDYPVVYRTSDNPTLVFIRDTESREHPGRYSYRLGKRGLRIHWTLMLTFYQQDQKKRKQ